MRATVTRFFKRFTLIELAIVLGVLVLLMALLVPVLKEASEKSQQIACINNLRSLSLGIQMHYNQHQAYPKGDLSEDLSEYLENTDQEIFSCPASGRIYDSFYVAREGIEATTNSSYSIGCPHHQVVNLGLGKGTRHFSFGKVLHDGQEIAMGSEVTGGILEFEDGSTVKLDSTGKVTVVSSFRTNEGILYTILRILERDMGTIIDATVTPGSSFEVVTPAAIAGVEGTVFRVKTARDAATEEYSTEVSVSRGKVRVVGRGKEGEPASVVRLKKGESAVRKAKGRNVQKDPPKKGKGKKKK